MFMNMLSVMTTSKWNTASSVSDSIKVVEMWVNGKFHRVNWMSDVGRDKLMSGLDKDMTDRMCGTGEYSTEIDLDRDVPMMEALYNVRC